MMRSVLLVEGNEELNEVNYCALARDGYEVLNARTLTGARELLFIRKPEVILLDVVMPDGDGIDFCNEIRVRTHISSSSLHGRSRKTGAAV